MPIRVETPGCQVLYGVNSRFKFNLAGSVPALEAGEGNVLHLTRAKPEIVVMNGVPFQAIYNGTMIGWGEFYYTSPNGMLMMFNEEDAIGIEPDDEDTAEIPLTEAIDPMVALADLHLDPEPAV